MLPEDQYGLEDEESMELHYFKIHDHDKNNKLDGLELGAWARCSKYSKFEKYNELCSLANILVQIVKFFSLPGAAMTHYHDEDENGKTRDRHVDVTDNELFDLIMQTLKDDDLNDDGYVDFFEFTKAHRRGVPAAEEAASI